MVHVSIYRLVISSYSGEKNQAFTVNCTQRQTDVVQLGQKKKMIWVVLTDVVFKINEDSRA